MGRDGLEGAVALHMDSGSALTNINKHQPRRVLLQYQFNHACGQDCRSYHIASYHLIVGTWTLITLCSMTATESAISYQAVTAWQLRFATALQPANRARPNATLQLVMMQVLFYELMLNNVEELMPIVYTVRVSLLQHFS